MNKTKRNAMVIFKLFVDNSLDIIHYDKSAIENRKREILKQWVNGNKYGSSNWTNKNKPQFKIRGKNEYIADSKLTTKQFYKKYPK